MPRPYYLRILRKLANRLLICFIIIWMTVFYPAVCQYHGLLLFDPPAMKSQYAAQRIIDTPSAEHGHALSSYTAETGELSKPVLTQASAPAKSAPAPTLRHRTATPETVTMVLSGLVFFRAGAFIVPMSYTSQTFIPPLFSHQHQPSPPDKPPRVSPV